MTGKSRLDLKAQILVHPAAAHIILAVPATANPTLTPESREDESPASPATWPLSGTRCIKLKARRCRPPGYYPPGRSSGARCSESPAMPAPGFKPELGLRAYTAARVVSMTNTRTDAAAAATAPTNNLQLAELYKHNPLIWFSLQHIIHWPCRGHPCR